IGERDYAALARGYARQAPRRRDGDGTRRCAGAAVVQREGRIDLAAVLDKESLRKGRTGEALALGQLGPHRHAANDPGPVRDAVVRLGVGACAVATADEPRTPGPVARRCKRLRLQADAITEPEPAHRDHLLLVTEGAGPGG